MARITVFTDDACEESYQVKELLQEQGMPFVEINLAEYPDRRVDMIQLSHQVETPQIFWNDDHVTKMQLVQRLNQWQDQLRAANHSYKNNNHSKMTLRSEASTLSSISNASDWMSHWQDAKDKRLRAPPFRPKSFNNNNNTTTTTSKATSGHHHIRDELEQLQWEQNPQRWIRLPNGSSLPRADLMRRLVKITPHRHVHPRPSHHQQQQQPLDPTMSSTPANATGRTSSNNNTNNNNNNNNNNIIPCFRGSDVLATWQTSLRLASEVEALLLGHLLVEENMVHLIDGGGKGHFATSLWTLHPYYRSNCFPSKRQQQQQQQRSSKQAKNTRNNYRGYVVLNDLLLAVDDEEKEEEEGNDSSLNDSTSGTKASSKPRDGLQLVADLSRQLDGIWKHVVQQGQANSINNNNNNDNTNRSNSNMSANSINSSNDNIYESKAYRRFEEDACQLQLVFLQQDGIKKDQKKCIAFGLNLFHVMLRHALLVELIQQQHQRQRDFNRLQSKQDGAGHQVDFGLWPRVPVPRPTNFHYDLPCYLGSIRYRVGASTISLLGLSNWLLYGHHQATRAIPGTVCGDSVVGWWMCRRWWWYRTLHRLPRITTDIRIVMALSWGTCSSPKMILYHPQALEEELQWTAQHFCEKFIGMDEQHNLVLLPKHFAWYRQNFLERQQGQPPHGAVGGSRRGGAGILEHVVQYMTPSQLETLERMLAVHNNRPPTETAAYNTQSLSLPKPSNLFHQVDVEIVSHDWILNPCWWGEELQTMPTLKSLSFPDTSSSSSSASSVTSSPNHDVTHVKNNANNNTKERAMEENDELQSQDFSLTHSQPIPTAGNYRTGNNSWVKTALSRESSDLSDSKCYDYSVRSGFDEMSSLGDGRCDVVVDGRNYMKDYETASQASSGPGIFDDNEDDEEGWMYDPPLYLKKKKSDPLDITSSPTRGNVVGASRRQSDGETEPIRLGIASRPPQHIRNRGESITSTASSVSGWLDDDYYDDPDFLQVLEHGGQQVLGEESSWLYDSHIGSSSGRHGSMTGMTSLTAPRIGREPDGPM